MLQRLVILRAHLEIQNLLVNPYYQLLANNLCLMGSFDLSCEKCYLSLCDIYVFIRIVQRMLLTVTILYE